MIFLPLRSDGPCSWSIISDCRIVDESMRMIIDARHSYTKAEKQPCLVFGRHLVGPMILEALHIAGHQRRRGRASRLYVEHETRSRQRKYAVFRNI